MTESLLIIAAVSLLLIMQYCYRLIINYQVRDDSICIVLIKTIPLVKMRFGYIKSLKIISFGEYLFAWHWRNKIWGTSVLITRCDCFFNPFIITPDDPGKFIKEVSEKMSKAGFIVEIKKDTLIVIK